MTPHKVLWLTKGLGRGGAERLLVSSATHLDRSRFQVDVAYLLPEKDALVPELAVRGVYAHCLGQRSSLDLTWVARLRRLLHEGEYDLVHSHMPLPAAAARVLASRRTALVHTEHNVWQRYRKATYWANALTYRRNDAVIAVSEGVRSSIPGRWLPRPPAPVEVVVHGVEHGVMQSGAEARRAGRDLLALPDEALVVGTVGNFTPKKDQARLVEAVGRLVGHVPDLRLVLVGSGPLEPELRRQVADSDLEEVVVFAGSRDDVPRLLPAFDVFCLSSLHEGLSIAIIEALASGVPAVCTAVGGVPEVFEDGTAGLLVPAGDTAALAAALRRLLSDPDLRRAMGVAALERSAAFDISSAVRRTQDLYDTVLLRR